MSSVTIKINGLMRTGLGEQKNVFTLTFKGKRIRLSTALSKSGLNSIADRISFFAINGVRCANSDWIKDGDIIDVFPIVIGG